MDMAMGMGNGSSMGGGGMQMTMQMSFYASAEATILFVGWHTTTWSEMLGSCIAVLVMSVIYEGLKTFRQFLKERSLVVNRSLLDSYRSTTPTEEFSVGEITPPWLSAQRLYWLHHVTQSVLHLLQCTLSYFLMLIAMTFNVWLFISIVIGSMLGYFICNLKRSLRADVVQDHCH